MNSLLFLYIAKILFFSNRFLINTGLSCTIYKKVINFPRNQNTTECSYTKLNQAQLHHCNDPKVYYKYFYISKVDPVSVKCDLNK